jgi:hypothetical protein
MAEKKEDKPKPEPLMRGETKVRCPYCLYCHHFSAELCAVK